MQHDEAVIKLALEQTHEGLQIIDRNWRYVYVNAAAAAHGHSTKEKLTGKTMMECYPGIEETEMFGDLQYVMHHSKPRRVENEFAYADGTKCWFELFIEPFDDGILVRTIDITSKKSLESQLVHSQKMEAIGRLAGGIAHDFNNKLAIMLVYCEMIRSSLKERKDPMADHIEKVLSAVHFSSNLTRQLLAFSRKQVLDPKVADLNEIISETRDGLQKVIEENISIVYELSPDLKKVRVDPVQVEQVILNLCINARDSMPEGGRLIIETSNVELDSTYAGTRVDVTPGDYVMMSFTDTGGGMEPSIVDKIFEPFFTTKDQHKGTGLGLSTVHGIVKQSRGHIWVYSEVGIGSVFKVYFPVAKEKLTAPQKSSPTIRSAPKAGSDFVLIAEDDPHLREAYCLALKAEGYNVVSAGDATEAIEIFKACSPYPGLLLTDLVLPGKSGRYLSEELQKISPDLKVIFMSGYTENSIVHHGILDTENVLLQKPITIKNLLDTLERVFEGKLTKGLF